MIICICNNFNDKAVNEYLATIPGQKTTVKEVYKACSGGEKPVCGICTRNDLKDIVVKHNDGIKPPPVSPPP